MAVQEEHTFLNVHTTDLPEILEDAFGIPSSSTSDLVDRLRQRRGLGQTVGELLEAPDRWIVRILELGHNRWLVRGERLL